MSIPRMNYPQYRKARKLTHECCNYCDGNCLLLDDGEECVCVQSITISGFNRIKLKIVFAYSNTVTCWINFHRIIQTIHFIKRCSLIVDCLIVISLHNKGIYIFFKQRN